MYKRKLLSIPVEFGGSYEHPELGELDVWVTATVEPYDPGVLTGPYENSYPPSGGGIDGVVSVVVDGGPHDKRVLDHNEPHLAAWLDSDDVQGAADLAAAEHDEPDYDPAEDYDDRYDELDE